MKKLIPADSVLIPNTAQKVFTGQIFDVYQWSQAMFDGSKATFEMLKRPDTVTSICIVDNKIIVLNEEQPNSGLRKSFPGGRVDETDEDIIFAAKREALEETGYSFKNWRLIKVWQPHTKLEWFIHLTLAWDVIGQQDTSHEPGEKISIDEISFDEVKELVITKSGYLGESTAIFEELNSMEELLKLPEFSGNQVDR